jgi:hypothetical protein
LSGVVFSVVTVIPLLVFSHPTAQEGTFFLQINSVRNTDIFEADRTSQISDTKRKRICFYTHAGAFSIAYTDDMTLARSGALLPASKTEAFSVSTVSQI